MSRDGLLWPWAGRIHPRFRTPYISSIVVGFFVAVLAMLVPLSILDEMVSVGTLLAFVLVSAGVLVCGGHIRSCRVRSRRRGYR